MNLEHLVQKHTREYLKKKKKDGHMAKGHRSLLERIPTNQTGDNLSIKTSGDSKM